MSIAMLEQAAAALGALTPRVVFVGGATIPLWITDAGASALRTTDDVDVVVDVVTRSDFHAFEDALRHTEFNEDQLSGVICRWRHAPTDLTLDVMAARADIQGFENRWQRAAVPMAIERTLPSGTIIRAASPPYLLAMKLEAFASRGRNDFYGSRDFADIATLLSGRAELVEEVEGQAAVRDDVADRLADILRNPRMRDGVVGTLPFDPERVDDVVLRAMRRLARPA